MGEGGTDLVIQGNVSILGFLGPADSEVSGRSEMPCHSAAGKGYGSKSRHPRAMDCQSIALVGVHVLDHALNCDSLYYLGFHLSTTVGLAVSNPQICTRSR
ncbi:hypothetical protein RSAG8_03909, partial [Rhizoctonia solani AG-8 WAC10335]